MSTLASLNFDSPCGQNCRECPYFNYTISKINMECSPILSDVWIKSYIKVLFYALKTKNIKCHFDEYKI